MRPNKPAPRRKVVTRRPNERKVVWKDQKNVDAIKFEQEAAAAKILEKEMADFLSELVGRSLK